MNIPLENLKLIEDIHKILILIRDEEANKIEKRWLTTEELSEYIGYSKESIKKMISYQELQLNKHYFKVVKKNLFDKHAIDKWIMGIDGQVNFDSESKVSEIIKAIA